MGEPYTNLQCEWTSRCHKIPHVRTYSGICISRHVNGYGHVTVCGRVQVLRVIEGLVLGAHVVKSELRFPSSE